MFIPYVQWYDLKYLPRKKERAPTTGSCEGLIKKGTANLETITKLHDYRFGTATIVMNASNLMTNV